MKNTELAKPVMGTGMTGLDLYIPMQDLEVIKELSAEIQDSFAKLCPVVPIDATTVNELTKWLKDDPTQYFNALGMCADSAEVAITLRKVYLLTSKITAVYTEVARKASSLYFNEEPDQQ